MSPTREVERSMVPPFTPPRDGIKVPLACPECGEAGIVDWKNLKNGIGCSKCGCQFLIDRTGRVLSQAELPRIRYTCPRCKKSGSIPSIIAAKGTNCPECQLPLAVGPDQRLHGRNECEKLRRTVVHSKMQPPFCTEPTLWFRANDGHVRKSMAIASVAVLAMGVMGVGLAVRSYFDNSPEKMARQFALACLSGDRDAPLAYLEDDAVQHASFDRWRVRYFPSIVDGCRPTGDTVRIEIKTLTESADTCTCLVTMKSSFIGARSQVQKWRLRDGKWRFDARATLTREANPRTNQGENRETYIFAE